MTAEYGNVPFEQAIQYFRAKLKLQQTPKWPDMLHEQHTNAFTVAGATNDAILTDFYQAVDKAITQGTTLADFRKDFDTIVDKHGWSYNGSRGWRSKVIYETNLRTAYAAGRYHQMTDPDVVRYRPYWRYRHDDSVKHARQDHKAWDGLVLAHDDAWWNTHYPPNGWGCKCSVEPITRRELASSGKGTPDQAPPLDMEQKTLNTSAGAVDIDVPKGIDPGWGYRPGSGAALKLSREEDQLYAANRDTRFTNLTPGDWQQANRPKVVPHDRTQTKLWPITNDAQEIQQRIEQMIGGKTGVLMLPTGHGVAIDATIPAQYFALNDPSRARFVALLPELLANPFEIWASFQQEKATGRMVLRQNIIKAFEGEGGKISMTMVVQAEAGHFVGVTILPTAQVAELNKRRVGALIFGRQVEP